MASLQFAAGPREASWSNSIFLCRKPARPESRGESLAESNSPSVSLLHCSLAWPLSCFQLPSMRSQFMLASSLSADIPRVTDSETTANDMPVSCTAVELAWFRFSGNFPHQGCNYYAAG